ncbi:MAG: hypothetical protein Q4P15_04990 [Propionibacteriaceae bacterium]|nr:hypothetical protein [Propionibacteriaceae bacterium]
MSNQQWPPPQGNGPRPVRPDQSPWSQPDARWSPQSYRDTPGRDPHQPFGQAPPSSEPPRMDQFEPPRTTNFKTLWLGIGIVAAIIVLVLVLQFTGGFSASDPAASPTPTIQMSEGATPEPVATGGTSIPFEGNGTGVFEILSQTWTDEGVKITYRITLDDGQGERSFSLYMFNNASLQVAEPVNYELATVRTGTPFEGIVEFAVERGDSTLVLASGFGSALTALPIPE